VREGERALLRRPLQFLFQLRAPALAHLLGLPGDHPLLLSTSQAMSVALAAAAVTALWLRRSRSL
jgi:hypothetical protein